MALGPGGGGGGRMRFWYMLWAGFVVVDATINAVRVAACVPYEKHHGFRGFLL